MVQNRYKYFRWTKRTAGITFMYVAVIPVIVGYLGYQTDVSCFPFQGGWSIKHSIGAGEKRRC
jgi:hypothetical protein